MSAYTQVNLDGLRDKEALLYSLRQMGFDPQVFETGRELVGFSGHVNPKCEVILPPSQLRELHCYKEVGFEHKQTTGMFQLHINDMDQHKFSEEWKGELQLNYNDGLARRRAQQMGRRVVTSKRTVVNGRKHIQLVCQ